MYGTNMCAWRRNDSYPYNMVPSHYMCDYVCVCLQISLSMSSQCTPLLGYASHIVSSLYPLYQYIYIYIYYNVLLCVYIYTWETRSFKYHVTRYVIYYYNIFKADKSNWVQLVPGGGELCRRAFLLYLGWGVCWEACELSWSWCQ